MLGRLMSPPPKLFRREELPREPLRVLALRLARVPAREVARVCPFLEAKGWLMVAARALG